MSATLPDRTHLGTVRLQVSDLAQSLAYYEQVIGLRAMAVGETSASLGAHGDDRVLLELHTRPGVGRARRGAFGLYHFAILVPDRAALGRFAAHLASVNPRIGMADHFVSEALYLWDPDGLGIEVYRDRPRDEWRVENGELVMTTEDLDINDVVAAGGGEPWTGMPAGTTIGHVHLHVGDLAQADAFYHQALGFMPTVWSYPGALFLAAGGYHHHLGTNVWAHGPSAREDDARLLDWEVVLPDRSAVDAAVTVADPWGTSVRLTSA